MKKSIFSCAISATLLIAANASAQPHPGGQGGENRPNGSNMQSARPVPTPAAINNVVENRGEKREKFQNSSTEQKQEIMQKREDRIEDKQKRLENVSPDQKEKIMERRKDRREKFQQASPEERKEMRENRREKRRERSEARRNKMKPSASGSGIESSVPAASIQESSSAN